jgi:hypothetical protein
MVAHYRVRIVSFFSTCCFIGSLTKLANADTYIWACDTQLTSYCCVNHSQNFPYMGSGCAPFNCTTSTFSLPTPTELAVVFPTTTIIKTTSTSTSTATSSQSTSSSTTSPITSTSSTSRPNNGSSGLSADATAGIAIGAAVGGLLLVGAAAVWILRSRRKQRQAIPAANTRFGINEKPLPKYELPGQSAGYELPGQTIPTELPL